jgi:hypothetical protein
VTPLNSRAVKDYVGITLCQLVGTAFGDMRWCRTASLRCLSPGFGRIATFHQYISKTLLTSAGQYCGKDCQKAHWTDHKVYCKSPLMKSSWLPSWETDRRPPSFVGAGPPAVSHGQLQKYFWGNMPAVDILALNRNEGCSYDRDLKVLFAGEVVPLCCTMSEADHVVYSFWRHP